MATSFRYPEIISAEHFDAMRALSKADRSLAKATATRDAAVVRLVVEEAAAGGFLTDEDIALASFADVALGADVIFEHELY